MAGEVTTLVRLRWALSLRALSRNTAQAVFTVLFAIVGLVLTVMAAVGIMALHGSSPAARGIAVLGLTTLTGLWLGLAAISATTSPGLSVRSFAVLPVPPQRLALGLMAGRFAQPTTAALLVIALATVWMWGGGVSMVVASLAAVVLGVVTTVGLAATVVQVLDRLLTSKGGRAVGTVIAALIPAVPMLINLGSFGTRPVTSLEQLTPGIGIAGWTPLGWAWSIPWEVVHGRPAMALVKAGLALGLVAALWFGYRTSVSSGLERTPSSSHRQMRDGVAVSGRLSGPVGAIARRRVLTWRRDDRMLGALMQLLVLPFIMLAQGALLKQPFSIWLALYISATAAGASLSNDLALDGTAFWMHISAGVRGWQDRLGRVLAHVVVVGTVALVVAVGVTLTGLVSAPWRLWPIVLAALTTSLGVGAYMGALTVGSAPPPRGKPFASPPGGVSRNLLTGLVIMLLPLVAMIPVVALVISVGRFLPDTGIVHVLTTVVSLVYGIGALALGVVLGGRLLDRNGVELLATLGRAG